MGPGGNQLLVITMVTMALCFPPTPAPPGPDSESPQGHPLRGPETARTGTSGRVHLCVCLAVFLEQEKSEKDTENLKKQAH